MSPQEHARAARMLLDMMFECVSHFDGRVRMERVDAWLALVAQHNREQHPGVPLMRFDGLGASELGEKARHNQYLELLEVLVRAELVRVNDPARFVFFTPLGLITAASLSTLPNWVMIIKPS